MIPTVAWEDLLPDPEGDLEDPIGLGLAYVNCALERYRG